MPLRFFETEGISCHFFLLFRNKLTQSQLYKIACRREMSMQPYDKFFKFWSLKVEVSLNTLNEKRIDFIKLCDWTNSEVTNHHGKTVATKKYIELQNDNHIHHNVFLSTRGTSTVAAVYVWLFLDNICKNPSNDTYLRDLVF